MNPITKASQSPLLAGTHRRTRFYQDIVELLEDRRVLRSNCAENVRGELAGASTCFNYCKRLRRAISA